jgi:hypothetical protein
VQKKASNTGLAIDAQLIEKKLVEMESEVKQYQGGAVHHGWETGLWQYARCEER